MKDRRAVGDEFGMDWRTLGRWLPGEPVAGFERVVVREDDRRATVRVVVHGPTGLRIADPRIPIDNNATERALRGVVVGRKNHYGSRSRRGTEVAALFYSLVETAKLTGDEPKAYLRRAVFAALRGEPIPLPTATA